MSSGGGGSTSTTQSGPPAEFIQAYQRVNNQANNVASQPLQQYPGNLVAGFSPDQQAAMGTIQNTQGIANPFINAAAQEIGQSTTPLAPSLAPYIHDQDVNLQAEGRLASAAQYTHVNPNNISEYFDPYTQKVINSTQAQFNNQNAQQQQGVVGNAISQGAFGGDRSAVAQGITAGQQQLAQAPVIANLQNQGWQQAVQEANTQQQALLQGQGLAGQLYQNNVTALGGQAGQVLGANQANNWLASQAGYGLANLGNEAQNTALTGANAQLGIGGLEQQLAQEQLNIPYEQFTAQQAYPFQTTGWLANIAEGLGGASGGTSSTTSPGPSAGSQIAGGLTAGAGILGATGAFGSGGSSGWLSGGGGGVLDSGSWDVARGGAVPRAGGGLVPVPTGVPDVSMSVVPGAQGMGTAPSHAGSNLLNTSTGSTTTSDGGGSGGADAMKAIGTVASIAALVFSDRRLKTDIAKVGNLHDGTPIHRYRYKGDPRWHIGVIHDQAERHHPEATGRVGGIGIVDTKGITDNSAQPERRRGGGIMNDNDNSFAPQRRAAGGPATINIPQLPPGPSGISFLPSPNGVAIPQIGDLRGMGAQIPGGGITSINDYLANTKATAAPVGLSAPSGKMVSDAIEAAKPKLAAVPMVGAPGGDVFGFAPNGTETGGVGGPGDVGGGMADGSGSNASENNAEASNAGAAGGNAADAGAGADSEAGEGGGGGDAEGGGEGGGGDGEWRGGRVARRANAGGLPDWAIRDTAAPDAPSPGLGLGITDDNTADWRDSAPTMGGIAASPQFDMPDTGTGSAPPDGPTVPTTPVLYSPSKQIAASGPGPGAGISAGPPPPPPPAGGGDVPWQDDGPAARSAPVAAGATEHGHKFPWETLIAAGLGMMGGSSPYAGVNIGRGALKGLEYGEQQRVHDETAELRRLQQEDLSAWRQTQGDINQQKANTGDTRAGTYQQNADQRANYNNRVLELRSRGLDDAAANRQAMMEWRQGNQDISLANSIDRRDQSNRRGDQADRRADQTDTRLQQQQAAQQASLDLRRQALAQSKDQNEQRAIQTATNSDLRTAATIVANNPGMKYSKALDMVRDSRDKIAPAPPPAAAATPPVPTNIQNGWRYQKQGDVWVPVSPVTPTS